jgi:hypothetical protein
MSHSQTLKPEHRASPKEAKRASRDWCKYKAGVILKKHPALNRDDLIAYLELQPWDSFSLNGYKTIQSVPANEAEQCEQSPCTTIYSTPSQ